MTKVTAKTKDGRKLTLVYNERVLLYNKEDEVSFYVDSSELVGEFIFKFSNEGDSLTAAIDYTGNKVTITLYQWDSEQGIYTTEPLKITADNKITLWIQFKTATNQKSRAFEISIWREDGT